MNIENATVGGNALNRIVQTISIIVCNFLLSYSARSRRSFQGNLTLEERIMIEAIYVMLFAAFPPTVAYAMFVLYVMSR